MKGCCIRARVSTSACTMMMDFFSKIGALVKTFTCVVCWFPQKKKAEKKTLNCWTLLLKGIGKTVPEENLIENGPSGDG